MNGVTSLPMSSWPVGRKAVAGIFAVAGFTVLACAAVYVSAVLFLVLNKANPRQAELMSIVDYWAIYAGDAGLRKKLIGSMAAPALGLLQVFPLFTVVPVVTIG